jgi:hypothetical protein
MQLVEFRRDALVDEGLRLAAKKAPSLLEMKIAQLAQLPPGKIRIAASGVVGGSYQSIRGLPHGRNDNNRPLGEIRLSDRGYSFDGARRLQRRSAKLHDNHLNCSFEILAANAKAGHGVPLLIQAD